MDPAESCLRRVDYNVGHPSVRTWKCLKRVRDDGGHSTNESTQNVSLGRQYRRWLFEGPLLLLLCFDARRKRSPWSRRPYSKIRWPRQRLHASTSYVLRTSTVIGRKEVDLLILTNPRQGQDRLADASFRPPWPTFRIRDSYLFRSHCLSRSWHARTR
jgi:hypothetical protein